MDAQTLPRDNRCCHPSQEIFLVGLYAELCCINLIIMRVSAAAFMGIILRSFSILFTDQCLHQHRYLSHYMKQVVAIDYPNIGFCQKLRRYLKIPGRKLLIGLTLLHSTHRKVKSIYLIFFSSATLFLWDLKASINIACITKEFFDCHTEMRCYVIYNMCDLQRCTPTL